MIVTVRRGRSVLAPLLVLSILTLPTSGSGATSKPDLRIRSVTATDSLAEVGGSITIRDVTKNVGRAGAGRSTTTYFLSSNATVGSDRKIGKRLVPKLARGASSKGTSRAIVPAAMTPGDYRLIACADQTKKVTESNEKNNCLVGQSITVRAATDHDLIDRALAAGEIDEETAITYEVFSDFGDPRLPARFQGEDSETFESDVLSEVAANFTSFSPATQATLEPFLVPPFHHGSWWAIQNGGSPNPPLRMQTDLQIRCSGGAPSSMPNLTQWGYEDAAGGKVRIWWQEANQLNDQPLAQNMAAEIDHHIWPQIITSMGYAEPLGDGGSSTTCRGGTDAYDISLVDIPRAHTWTLDKCDGTWAGTLFNRNQAAADIPEILAHEFFHAVQMRYDVKNGCLSTGGEYGFWKESTAQWIEDALYQTDNREHKFAPRMLDQPDLALDDPGSWAGEDRFYGEYLLPFFLARTGRSTKVKQIWDGTTGASMRDALVAPFGDGWDDVWKDFAVHNFNRGDYDYYKDWDGLAPGAELAADGTLGKTSSSFNVAVSPLSSKYIRITPTDDITVVDFENHTSGVEGMGVQVLVEYKDGHWELKDWSDTAEGQLCLNSPDVKTFTLVFTNSTKVLTSSAPPIELTLTGRKDLCCTGEETSGSRARSNRVDADAQSGDTCTATANLTYTLTQSSSAPTYRFNYQLTATVTTKMKWSRQYHAYLDDGSTFTYSGSGDDWFDAGATEECPNNTAEQEWVDNGSGPYRNSQGPQGYIDDSKETFEMIPGAWWYMRQHTRTNNCTGETTTDVYENGPTNAYPCPWESPILGWTFQKESQTAETETYSIDCGYQRDINGANPFGGPLHIVVAVSGTITVRKP